MELAPGTCFSKGPLQKAKGTEKSELFPQKQPAPGYSFSLEHHMVPWPYRSLGMWLRGYQHAGDLTTNLVISKQL